MSNGYKYCLKRAKTVDEYISLVKDGYCYIDLPKELHKDLYLALKDIKDQSDDLLYAYSTTIVGSFVKDIDEPEEFFNIHKSLIEKGYTNSYNQLGLAYYYGYGVDKDEDKANEYFEIGASYGEARAIFNVAITAQYKRDWNKCFEYCLKAAELGHYRAELFASECYFKGIGTTKDLEKGQYWINKAIEDGNDEAICRLGELHRTGYFVEKSEEKALELFHQAAKLNNLNAIKALGDKYRTSMVRYINDGYELIEEYLNIAKYWYRIGASLNDKDCQLYLSDIAYLEKEYDKAIEWLKEAANNNNKEAQYRLGLHYEYGEYIEASYEKAFELYKSAAENNHTKALIALGYWYFNKKKYEEAFNYFLKASTAFTYKIDACYNLGYCYEYGLGTDIDLEKAKECYFQAFNELVVYTTDTPKIYKTRKVIDGAISRAEYWIEQDTNIDPEIYFKYGRSYIYTDIKKAIHWFSKAVNLGHVEAIGALSNCYDRQGEYKKALDLKIMYFKKVSDDEKRGYALSNIAYYYIEGLGVPKDINTAVQILFDAAKLGNKRSMWRVGNLLVTSKIKDKEIARQALLWLKKAAEEGYDEAEIDYGYFMEVTSKKYETAFYWYEKAAKKGNAIAQTNVGFLYERGCGVEQDYQKAIYWYNKAKHKNARANFRLARLYENGLGVEIDLYKALDLYKVAYSRGYSCKEAIERVEKAIKDAEYNHAKLKVDKGVDIFISWNHHNFNEKEQIKALLNENGIHPWDSDENAEGELNDDVRYAINHAKGYFIILSPQAMLSGYMPLEVNMIFERLRRDHLPKTLIRVVLLDSNYDVYSDIAKLGEKHAYQKLLSGSIDFSFGLDNIVKAAQKRIAEYKVIEYQVKLRDEFDVFPISLTDELIEKDGGSVATFISYEDGYINRPLLDDLDNKYESETILKSKEPVFIYGEGGSGKSLYLKNLIGRNNDDQKIFFYLPCGDISKYIREDRVDIYGLISKISFKIAKYDNISPEMVKDMLNNDTRTFYLIIDALDEDEDDKKRLINLLKDFLMNAPYQNIHLLVTSRNKSDGKLLIDSLEKEFLLLTIKGLEEEDIINMFDSISKRNQSNDVSKDTFVSGLEFIAPEIKKNPLLMFNLIYVYFVTRKLPQQKYEILSDSNQIMVNALEKTRNTFDEQEQVLKETYFNGINDLLETISYDLSINSHMEINLVDLIKDILDEKIDNSNLDDIQKEIYKRDSYLKAKSIYKYLRSRRIVVSNRISHSIYQDFFAANYMYKRIYDLNAKNEDRIRFFNFQPNGLKQLEKYCSNNKFFANNDNPWVEITLDFISKIDYEVHNYMNKIDINDDSYLAYHQSMTTLLRREGISNNAYKLLLDMINRDLRNTQITLFNFATEISEYMKR